MEVQNKTSAIGKAIDLIGDRWALMILSSCFSGISKFSQFRNFLNINGSLLSKKLNKLVETGLLKRELYSESPKRFEYKLTETSRDLLPIIVGLEAWADRHYNHDASPLTPVHNMCDQKVEAAIYCEAYRTFNDNVAAKIHPCLECRLSFK